MEFVIVPESVVCVIIMLDVVTVQLMIFFFSWSVYEKKMSLLEWIPQTQVLVSCFLENKMLLFHEESIHPHNL